MIWGSQAEAKPSDAALLGHLLLVAAECGEMFLAVLLRNADHPRQEAIAQMDQQLAFAGDRRLGRNVLGAHDGARAGEACGELDQFAAAEA